MSAALRVAHIMPFPGVGGTEQGQLRLAEAVRSHGVESAAYCLDDAPAVQQFFREAGLDVVVWHRRDVDSWGQGSFTYRTLRLAWELRRRNTRIVHCSDTYAVSRQVTLAARLAGAAVVCHVRNRNERVGADQRPVLDAVRRFLFVSRATWAAYAYPVEPSRGLVLYDGVEAEPEPPSEDVRVRARKEVERDLALPPGAPLIGMIARVEPQKDFRTLARATARLAEQFPTLRVLVVGGTDATPEQRAHFPEVQRIIAECGVAENIVFTGVRRDVPRLLRAMDVSVLSTHWEGLPLVLSEAMAQGTPIVATAVDGIPEAIQDGRTGLLVRHEDDAALAARVTELLTDAARARRIGRAGHAHVRTTFSSGCFADTVLRAYREASNGA